jgi:hypothetical protein
MPAPPTPAIALPMMNAAEFGAAPHMAEAISKSKTLDKRTSRTGKNV